MAETLVIGINVDGLLAGLGAARETTRPLMDREVRRHGNAWLVEAQRHTKQLAPDATKAAGATGLLVNSIQVDPMRASGTGGPLTEWTGRVFSSVPHAIVMEKGRRPGAAGPPSSALIPWVERAIRRGALKVEGVRTPGVVKGARKVRGRVARKRITFRGNERAKIRSLAFVIARSIHRKGWPNPGGRGRRRPYAMFEGGLKASRRFIQADVAVLGQDLAKIAASAMTGRK